MNSPVIPAKAGTSGQEVYTGLTEAPAFAGVTGCAGVRESAAYAGATDKP
jgi:hypothetical protein